MEMYLLTHLTRIADKQNTDLLVYIACIYSVISVKNFFVYFQSIDMCTMFSIM